MDKVVEIEDDSENDFNNMAIMKAKAETDFLMGNYKNALKTIATVPKSKCSRINTAKFMRLHFVTSTTSALAPKGIISKLALLASSLS